MPGIDPTGPLSLLLSNLRTLVAACPAFQTWVGAADAAAALSRVHPVDYPPPEAGSGEPYTAEQLAALRPAAIVNFYVPQPGYFGAAGNAHAQKRVAMEGFAPASRLVLKFEADIPDEDADNAADAIFRFANPVGAVMQEMLDRSGTDGYLVIDTLEFLTPFIRTDQTEEATQRPHWEIGLLVTVGI